MILVKTFYAYNDLRNFTYLIYDGQSAEAWVIDPYEANPIIDYIKKSGLVLRGILNTHQHFDHIRGNAPLLQAFPTKVCKLKNSETIQLYPGHSLETLDTPGHTMDHQVFIWKKDHQAEALFSGDTLFNSGVGNCRGGGDVNSLYHTTKKLLETLPTSTLLYPGHDYRKKNLEFALKVESENVHIKESLRELKELATETLPPVTLGHERKVNPFFRLDSAEIKESIGGDVGNEKELFIELRKLRDQW
jgi:hydroxyacylglutathione hydrolase